MKKQKSSEKKNNKNSESNELNNYVIEYLLLKKLKEESTCKKIPIISDDVGYFLKITAYLKNPLNVLEIGCGIGYSTYFILSGCFLSNKNNYKNIDKGNALNINNNFVYIGIDLNKERIIQAKSFINNVFYSQIQNKKNKIIFIWGNALKILTQFNYDDKNDDMKYGNLRKNNNIKKNYNKKEYERLHQITDKENSNKLLLNHNKNENIKFDFVFIDAAKFEYPKYLNLIKPLLANDSLVVADNIFYSGKIFKDEVTKHDYNSVNGIKEFLKLISEKNIFKTMILNIGDGISFSKYLYKGAF